MENFLTKEITIAGKRIPVYVPLLGGGGALALFLVSRRGFGSPYPSTIQQNPTSPQPNPNPETQPTTDWTKQFSEFQDLLTSQQTGFQSQLGDLIAQQQAEQNKRLEALAAQNQSALAGQAGQFNSTIAGLLDRINQLNTQMAAAAAARENAYQPDTSTIDTTPQIQYSQISPAPVYSPIARIRATATGTIGTATQAGGQIGSRAKEETGKKSSGLGTATGTVGTEYTIISGDTLSAIARRFQTTVARIAARNNIANVNRIRAGAKIYIA